MACRVFLVAHPDPSPSQVSTRKALEAELIATRSQLRAEWDGAVRWLEEYGFVDPTAARITRGPSKVEAGGSPDPAGPPTSITPPTSSAALCNALTPRGRACAAFADGQPLIMGTIISDGWLARLSLPDACAWICLFLRERRLQATAAEAAAAELPPLSPELQVLDSEAPTPAARPRLLRPHTLPYAYYTLHVPLSSALSRRPPQPVRTSLHPRTRRLSGGVRCDS